MLVLFSELCYELLAVEIRGRYGESLSAKVFLKSTAPPLQETLSRARFYTRSFYEASAPRGFARADGAICEDITSLTFEDGSLDIIVSSDVLEHVPRLDLAFPRDCKGIETWWRPSLYRASQA